MDLLSLREIGEGHGRGLSLSPNGEFLAFELHQSDVETNAYRVAWFVAPTASGAPPINVGDAGDAELFRLGEPDGTINGAWYTTTPKWSQDSKWIIYRRKVDGEIQLWRSSRDGLHQEQLTTNSGDVEDFTLTADGTAILFATDASRKHLQDAVRKESRTGYLFDYERRWATQSGKPYREQYAITGGQPLIWSYDLDSGTERPATKKESEAYALLLEPPDSDEPLLGARSIRRTADGDRVAWLQPTDPREQGIDPPLTVYAVRDGLDNEPVQCTAGECTGLMETRHFLGGLWWNDAGDEIYFVRKEGSAYSERALYSWRIGEDSVQRLLTTDEWISGCTRSGARALCFRQPPDHPRTIVSIELSNGLMTTLVDPNPEFRNLRLGEVERMVWSTATGESTFGFLIKPLDYEPNRRYPLVIVGYLARYALRGGVGSEFPVHQLAANGFAVLVYERPVDRRMRALEADLTALAIHDWGPAMYDYRTPLALFEAAIDKLDEQGIIDATRVGIAGLSNGSIHAGYSIVHSTRFAAAVVAASEQSPASYFLSGVNGAFRRDLQNKTGFGRPDRADAWKWRHVSKALNAGLVNTPLLIQSSDFEHLRSLQDVITLVEAGKPVEMFVFPDEHHVKWQPVHRYAAYERSYDWFNFWLREKEDPDPEKADQYARWRSMRNGRAIQSQ